MSNEIIMKIGVFYILSLLLALAFRIAMMLCIGYSCKARAAKNQTAWVILTFFFPIAAPFIFLCVKDSIKKKCPKLCVNCGTTVHPEAIACYNCGNAVFRDYMVTDAQRYKSNSKTMLIISLIAFIASVAFGATCFVQIFKEVPPIDENIDPYGYFDEFDTDDYEQYFDDYFSEQFDFD